MKNRWQNPWAIANDLMMALGSILIILILCDLVGINAPHWLGSQVRIQWMMLKVGGGDGTHTSADN